LKLRTVLNELSCKEFYVHRGSQLDWDVVVSLERGVSESEGVIRLSSLESYERLGGYSQTGLLLVHCGQDVPEEYRHPEEHAVMVSSVLSFESFAGGFEALVKRSGILAVRRERLFSSFLDSYDVQQFATRAAEVIGNPLIVSNSDHRLLATAGDIPEDRADVRESVEQGYVSEDANAHLEEDGVLEGVRAARHSIISENERTGLRSVTSIVYHHHLEMGRLDVFEVDKRIDGLDLELIDYASSLVGLLIDRLGAAGDRVGFGSSVLLDLLSDGFVNEETMRAQLRLAEIPLDETYVLVGLAGQRGAGREYYSRAGRLAARALKGCAWTVYQDTLVFLLPLGKSAVPGYDDYDRAARRIRASKDLASMLENNDMRAYVSEPFTDPTLSRGRYDQVRELAEAVGFVAERVVFFWDHRYLVMSSSAKSFEQIDMMLDKRVVAMAAYDREHGTSYLETAILSVKHPGSPAEAARELNVHRNTYFYRMNKVRELFYLDLKDGEDRLDVAFSARIMEGLGERLMFDRASVPSEFAG
jgi:hypothetical protein